MKNVPASVIAFRAPRNRGGAASPIYIGTTMEADPNARADHHLRGQQEAKAGENAAARTPVINSVAVISIVRCRPIRFRLPGPRR